VSRSSSSPEQVVYQLLPPSSDLELASANSIDHGPFVPSPDVRRASYSDLPLTVTIERTKDQSSLYIREYVPEGDPRYKPQTVTLITLKGGRDLFPGFDLPTALPPLSSYTEASILEGSDSRVPVKIDGIGACGASR
jgi:hypothetical protein